MKLLIDVDGVLAEFVKSFYDLGRRFDENVPHVATANQQSWHDWVGMDNGLVSKCWDFVTNSREFWYNLDPLPSEEELTKLAKIGNNYYHEVYFVTSRPGITAQAQTENWLKRHVRLYNPTVVICHGSNKADFAKAVGVNYSIEDNARNATELGEVIGPGRSHILDRPYNQRATLPVRVRSLSEFFKRIEQTS